MENAVDALRMVAAILIFVIAIASSFSLFGTAKQTADSIITMRDKQAYLEAAELDGGILYTSSSKIQGTELTDEEVKNNFGVTKKGDRIVELADVISTIQRYSKEKYGVTIVEESSGNVITRFDSNTEQIMSMWYRIDQSKLTAPKGYIEQLKKNTKTTYVQPNFTVDRLKELYKIEVPGSSIEHGAPWYGNEAEIQKRISCELTGKAYEKYDNGTAYQYYNNTPSNKKNIIDKLNGRTIIEVTNEIDNSTYLKQTDESGNEILGGDGEPLKSDLLQEYVMPTIEIVYIIR